jgi:hypothetical protein
MIWRAKANMTHIGATLGVALVAASLLATAATPARANEVCQQEIGQLRGELEKRGTAVRTTIERKRPPNEACAALRRFVDAENRMLTYLRQNQQFCMVPEEAINNAAESNRRSIQVRNQACTAAARGEQMQQQQAQQQRPQGPGLADAVGGARLPAPDSSGPIFNTLMGNALTR